VPAAATAAFAAVAVAPVRVGRGRRFGGSGERRQPPAVGRRLGFNYGIPPPPMASVFNTARRRYSRSRLLRDWRWASPRPHDTKAEFFSPPSRRRRYTVEDAATADGEALGVPAVSLIVNKGVVVDAGGAVAAVILDLDTAASPQPLCGSAPLRHPAGGHF